MINPKEVDEVLDEAQLGADEQQDVNIPEAPAVANIKVWIKGFGVMFTVRGEKLNDMIKKTSTLIDYAETHGWKNTWNMTPQGTPQAVVGQPTTSQPMCKIHGTPMTQRDGKFGTFWSCGKKNADGSWCSYKPPKE
jgi:hypothetical protein